MAKSARHTRLSISEFHRLVEGPGAAEELPRGPSGKASVSQATRTWVSKWGDQPLVVSEVADESLPPSGAKIETIEAFKEALDLCLDEYLNGFDASEAARCILELRAPQFHHYVIKRGVLRAMDEADRERELIAILFSSLYVREVLTNEQAARGFRSLLESLDDVSIDTPLAAPLLSHFLADALLEGIVKPADVAPWRDELNSSARAAGVLAEVERRVGSGLLSPPSGANLDAVQALRQQMVSVVEEYLCSDDVAEVRRRLRELNVAPNLLHNFVRVAITIAMERRDPERELVSRLLSRLAGHPLEQCEIAQGFEMLLSRLDDLSLDNPSAPTLVAGFLIRAVADDVLPPAFVRQLPPVGLTSAAHLEALERARAQLAAKHFSSRRQHVWGRAAGGGVEDLKRAMREIVAECLASGEVAEAMLCVKELGAHSFHHELVKQLIVISMDRSDQEQQRAVDLLRALAEEEVVSREQVGLGCQRAREAAEDLTLDNPRAPELISLITSQLESLIV